MLRCAKGKSADANPIVWCEGWFADAQAPWDVLQGPARVEEMDSSTLVLPGWQARVDDSGSLLLTPV